ncbi:hypothetical protein N7454_010455 [Penicillium verhagenii]|nr:hypothetical protein N7454_010455 [Penicillium verhagenii]
MADPISIIGLIADVSDIISSLIKYAKAVQSARSEMLKLSEEMFALRGILDHLAAQSSSEKHLEVYHIESEGSVPFNQDIMNRVLQTTKDFLTSLLKELQPAKTKLKSLKQKLEWPFTQETINGHLTRLERVKSWLILVITADHAAVERDMQQEIGALARSLTEDLRIREQERKQIADRELLEWIAPVSPANSHLRATEGHNIATGKWFIGGHLKHWLRYGDKKLFFLVGKSGTGKTTLFAQCVDELISMASYDESINFAYFYCTIGNSASQILANVLGSIVAQLSGKDDFILDNIRQIYHGIPKSQAHKRTIDTTALEDAIIKSASGKTKIIVLVDAINESHDIRDIEISLLKLASLSPNIRIMITTTLTMVYPGDVEWLSINAEMMAGDIKAYIDHRLEYDTALKDRKPEFKSEIRKTLADNADGSFRWVQLSMENICAQRTARSMHSALRNLPGTLREMYAKTLDQISLDDRPFVREALFWICFAQDHLFASQMLTLDVLNEVVVLDEKYTTLDEDMMLVPAQVLLDICQGLITQDQAGSVTLAHSSIKDFLTSDWIKSSRVSYFSMDPKTANTIIMRKCLAYLCLDNFKNGYTSRAQIFRRLKNYKSLKYASFMWPKYAAAADLGDSERRLVQKFFDTRHLPRQGNFGTWMQVLMPSVDPSRVETTHPLYYASSYGLTSVVKMILEFDTDLDINAPGGRVGATAVFAASNRQNFDTTDLLLKAGADPRIVDPGTGWTVFNLSQMTKWSGLRGPLSDWLSGQESSVQEEYRAKYSI